MYVDGSLVLLPRKLAGPMACLLVCLACSLGFPLSWHKLCLGDAIDWIGWRIYLAGEPHALLPEPIVWVCALCAAQGFADHGGEAGVVHQWSFLDKALNGNLVPDVVEGETTFRTIRH